MSERKGLLKKNFRFFLLLAVVATVIYLIARNLSAFGNVLLVVIGFGAMILVHELGHFIVAKLSGIKVEAFSLGLPPTFVGILRTENGYRVRVLPGFYHTEDEKSDGSLLTFTIGRKARPGETEYRIGLIPLGGYRRADGFEEKEFAVVPEWLLGGRMRGFGVLPPMSLTVAKLSKADANDLRAKTGLLPGDRIISVNGNNVDTNWELAEIVRNTLGPTVTILAERTDPVSKEVERVESQIRLNLSSAKRQVESEADLCHIYSIVPRLRITTVAPVSGKSGARSRLGRIKSRLLALVGKKRRRQEGTGAGGRLESGDIILAIGDVENPTYSEMRDVTIEHEGQELRIKVLRSSEEGVEETVVVSVVPKRPRGGDEAVIGIVVALDMEHLVVAKSIAVEGGPAKLEIPRGASITAVDTVPVSNFHDVIREIRRYDGERISLNWRIDERVAGGVAFKVDNSKDFISVEGVFAAPVPFEYLERLYRASGPIDAVVIGCRKAVTIVVQTYVSLKRLISGLVGQEELSGPFGIMAISYKIAAQRPLIEYVHFFGVISVLLAVFNLCIPVAPLDGGWLVLLLVEKIKGSALSERAQEAVAYVGVTFILALLVYLTYNDILNMFFR